MEHVYTSHVTIVAAAPLGLLFNQSSFGFSEALLSARTTLDDPGFVGGKALRHV